MAPRLAEVLLGRWHVAARQPEEVSHASKRCAMAQKKHMRGVSAKEQRQYEHIKEKAENPAAMASVPKR